MPILERESEHRHLRHCLADATAGTGRLVFVSGEMGIGKTTLVTSFLKREVPGTVTVAQMPFDGLSIPTPLGPLFDVVTDLGGDLRGILAHHHPRPVLFRTIEAAITERRNPTVIVAEDAHWADDASLEFIRFLGRRIGGMHALMIVTFRDDELPAQHPLFQLVGDLATSSAVDRITLDPLSVGAVQTLVGEATINVQALHTYTGGNPFFITEILSSGTQNPVTLREAVLGRAARLGESARATLDMAAILGMRIDPEILAAAVGRSIDRDVAEANVAGLLQPDGDALTFRHAAVHAVIGAAISPAAAPALHRAAFAVLQASDRGRTGHARLAYHAEQARLLPEASFHAQEAAQRATLLQSHREAASQYARALRCAHALDPAARAEMLEAQAYAHFQTAHIREAIAAQQEAADIWQAQGNDRRYGHNLRRLSRYWLFDGRYHHAAMLAEASWQTLRAWPDSAEFALSCGYLAEWRIRSDRCPEAKILADQATAIAQAVNDPPTTAHALITVGMVQMAMGDDTGIVTLEAGRTLAQTIGHEEFELRSLCQLAQVYGTLLVHPGTRSYAEMGLSLARTHDLSTMLALFGSVHLEMALNACDWETALHESESLIGHHNTGRLLLMAHVVRVRAILRTTGHAAAELAAARAHAERLDDPVARALITMASLEAHWLADDPPQNDRTAHVILHAAKAAGDLRTASELALWMHRTGVLDGDHPWIAAPFSQEIAGDFETAATMWHDAGIPLEAWRATARIGSEEALRAAHAGCVALRADPDARAIARQLRAHGFRGIPRGPRPSTRANAALLSRREVDVLTLIAEGASNREIADRLSVSPKTIDHHVSAILGKLGVANRQQATVKAQALGVLPHSNIGNRPPQTR